MLSPSSGLGQAEPALRPILWQLAETVALFGGVARDGDGVDGALDAVREKFGDEAIVRGRGFGTKLARQGPSRVE